MSRLKSLLETALGIRRVLKENLIEFKFSLLPRTSKEEHSFDQECLREGFDYKLIKFRHPYTHEIVDAFNT